MDSRWSEKLIELLVLLVKNVFSSKIQMFFSQKDVAWKQLQMEE